MRLLILLGVFLLSQANVQAQACDCPYPVIFLHGFTGNAETFTGTWDQADFKNIFGPRADIFHAVVNATTSSNIWGNDGVQGTADDDVLTFFNNESNALAPGCVYSMNFQNYWNEDPSDPQIIIDGCGAPGFFHNDSNESAIRKQGYALGKMIANVLAANPDKDKVIVAGHSMGGLETREYLQRTDGSGNHPWWVNPSSPDGHQIKKMITTATPHRGSNFFGSPWPFDKEEEEEVTRDGLPDINSEATRDLRYNYLTGCGFLGCCVCPGIYLFGGNESTMPLGFHNDDVNCDGDENDVLEGINESGSPDPWDGTKDNPNMPLPDNLRYTYITSKIPLDSGDGVVALARQWIYDGTTPVPSDGTAFRLTDTLLTDVDHLGVDDDINSVVRSLDEGDYPEFAWDINLDHTSPYAGISQVRSVQVPEGPNTTDPDWFRFFIPAGTTDDICILFTPNVLLSGRIEYFLNPSAYEDMTATGDQVVNFTPGSPQIIINLVSGQYNAGGDNYIRIIHDNVGYTDWKVAYKIQPISKVPVPVTLISLSAEQKENDIRVSWKTASEINNEKFMVERSLNNRDWQVIGEVKGSGITTSENSYWFDDKHPNIGKNFYRLNQIDFDGTNERSHIVQCNFSIDDPMSIVFFPNPFEDLLYFQVRNLKDAFELEVYNDIGQIVYQNSYEANEAEARDYSIPFADLAAGHYLIRVTSKNHLIFSNQLVKK